MNTASLYDKAYQNKAYNDRSDYKINIVKTWVDEFNLRTLLDVGCGRGHYLKDFPQATGLEPSTYLCENDLKHLDVINSDIQSFATDRYWDGLYCMDVLEHISHDEIGAVLGKLYNLAPKALYGIANHSDMLDTIELHLIQEDANWWRKLLEKYYSKVKLTYEPLNYFVFECDV